jgi:hypothetical protein
MNASSCWSGGQCPYRVGSLAKLDRMGTTASQAGAWRALRRTANGQRQSCGHIRVGDSLSSAASRRPVNVSSLAAQRLASAPDRVGQILRAEGRQRKVRPQRATGNAGTPLPGGKRTAIAQDGKTGRKTERKTVFRRGNSKNQTLSSSLKQNSTDSAFKRRSELLSSTDVVPLQLF